MPLPPASKLLDLRLVSLFLSRQLPGLGGPGSCSLPEPHPWHAGHGGRSPAGGAVQPRTVGWWPQGTQGRRGSRGGACGSRQRRSGPASFSLSVLTLCPQLSPCDSDTRQGLPWLCSFELSLAPVPSLHFPMEMQRLISGMPTSHWVAVPWPSPQPS